MRCDFTRDGALVNDIDLESGDHWSDRLIPARRVTRRGAPLPSLGMTNTSMSSRVRSSRTESYGSFASESRSASTTESGRSSASAVNAIDLPSGDMTTSRWEYAVFVNIFFGVPSYDWIQICDAE